MRRLAIFGAIAIALAACERRYAEAVDDAGIDASLAPGDDGGSNDGAVVDASNDDAARCDVLAVPSGAASEVAIGFDALDSSGMGTDGWKSIGHDRDGLCTTATSTDVCQPVSGASPSSQVDGDRGIDNAFGRSIMQTIRALDPKSRLSGYLVTDARGAGTLTLVMNGNRLDIVVVGARVVRSGTTGVFSAIIPTEPFVDEIVRNAARSSPMLCDGPTIESIKTQLRQASDIGKDGTQNPSATCDAITIGGNLTGVRDATAPDVLPGPDPCK